MLAPSDCSQGIHCPDLSNAARASLFNPYLLVANASVWATFPLEVAVRHAICGFYLFIFFPPGYVALWNSKTPQTHQWEGFLVFGNSSSFTTPSPGWISIPISFVSLFIFYILPYLLLKTMGCVSECLMSSTSIRKLFCGICWAFKWSFDELVGDQVVSLSYSSAILLNSR